MCFGVITIISIIGTFCQKYMCISLLFSLSLWIFLFLKKHFNQLCRERERERAHASYNYLKMYLGKFALPIGNTATMFICSFVMTGHRLVNLNFRFQKLSNTAQMRNQFSQLPWLCGKKNSCHWRTGYHMTQPGISSVGPCCRHLNYRLPLVIYLYNI